MVSESEKLAIYNSMSHSFNMLNKAKKELKEVNTYADDRIKKILSNCELELTQISTYLVSKMDELEKFISVTK